MQAQGGRAEALTLDQTDLGAVQAAFDDPYDVVLNSAGLARHGPASEADPDDFDSVVSINLRSAYFLSSYAARALMAACKPGAIFHI